MNVYDQAHSLARALKQSEEYQELLKAKKKLDSDPKHKEMLLDFRRYQWDAQKARVMGEELDEVTQRRFQQLAELVGINPIVQEYLGAEYRFGQIMVDLHKILASALAEWFESTVGVFEDQEDQKE